MDKKYDMLLLWLDVETTGLDPDADRILEIGMIATTPDLHRLDDGYHSVLAWKGEPSPFIRRMHGPNGLLDACAAPDAPDGFAVTLDARAYVERWLDRSSTLIPAGSTVRFDRDMTDRNMPGLLDGCSHRSLDVSSTRIAFEAWNPAVYPAMESSTDHRVMRCLDDTLRYAAAQRRLLCSIG